MKEYATSLGVWLGAHGVQLDSDHRSFLSSMDASQIAWTNLKSSKVYRESFDGPAVPELNALLWSFRCLAEFVRKCVRLDTQLLSRATTFKLSYLTAYTVIVSLQRLLTERQSSLSAGSTAAIGRVMSDAGVQSLVFGPKSRALRNALVHYDVPAGFQASDIHFNIAVLDFAAFCFPGMTPDDVDGVLGVVLEEI